MWPTLEGVNGGALGFALHPDFESEPAIFLCYHRRVETEEGVSFENRLARFGLDGDRLEGERVLIDGAPGGDSHNGCRVVVGPDRRLYFSTGDGNKMWLARD